MLELWTWVVVTCVACVVVLGAVALRFRRRPDVGGPTDVPAVPPTRWTPYSHPMGPVSGWPHLVDRPETVPSRSPADRSFVVD